MKKLLLSVTAAALLLAPAFAVADPKPKGQFSTIMKDNTISGNYNYSAGQINNDVDIANFPSLADSSRTRPTQNFENSRHHNQDDPAQGFLSDITVALVNNAGHSSAQRSGAELPAGGTEETPSNQSSYNQGASGSISESIFGNHINETLSAGSGVGNLEGLLDLFDNYQISHFDAQGDYVGSSQIEEVAQEVLVKE